MYLGGYSSNNKMLCPTPPEVKFGCAGAKVGWNTGCNGRFRGGAEMVPNSALINRINLHVLAYKEFY